MILILALFMPYVKTFLRKLEFGAGPPDHFTDVLQFFEIFSCPLDPWGFLTPPTHTHPSSGIIHAITAENVCSSQVDLCIFALGMLNRQKQKFLMHFTGTFKIPFVVEQFKYNFQ